MSTVIWRGDAQKVPQVSVPSWNVVPGVGETTTLTINGKDIVVERTASESDLNEYKTKVIAAIGQYNNDDIPEFAEVSAAISGTTLQVTGPTDGAPFTMTGSCSDGGVTFGVTTPTSPSGPNWASVADNWSTGSVPTTGDTVIFENSSVDCLYGLDAMTGDTIAVLRIKASYTGNIGLPVYNSNGYYEYRDLKLQLGATAVFIGEGLGAGVQRCNLDLENIQSEVIVYNTGTPLDPEIGSVTLVGTNASNVLRVAKGQVGTATQSETDAATFATIECAYDTNQDSDSEVIIGRGTTLTALRVWGGDHDCYADFTTLIQEGGEVRLHEGVSPSTSIDIRDGRCVYLSSGTLTQGYVSDGAVLEFGKFDTRTVANMTVYAGATLIDKFQTVTWSNPIQLVRCSISEVTLDLGTDVALAPS